MQLLVYKNHIKVLIVQVKEICIVLVAVGRLRSRLKKRQGNTLKRLDSQTVD